MRSIVGALLVSMLSLPSAAAQDLGTLRFPNSGAPAAQAPFLRGVLLLHSFEYERALAEFREAQRVDPGFAMAVWGEAMTHTHPVWNQQDLAAARAALARLGATPEARAARAPTPRERAWLGTLEVLYGNGTKEWRDTAYADAMGRLSAAYPEDDEAKLFHALAIIGLSQGDRDVPSYMRAGAIAQEVFARHPDHPGAAHYVIHAFDDPIHAPLGLTAANAYGPLAADAGHAHHMTSHIYLALGMWDDVVRANENAIATVVKHRETTGRPVPTCGHYPEWLMYGLQQQGRLREAAAMVEACAASPASTMGSAAGSLASVWAAWLVDARDWSGPMSREPQVEAKPPLAEAYFAFGTGYAATMRGDRAAADAAHRRLEAVTPRLGEGFRPYGEIMTLQIAALLKTLAGDRAGGVELARQAASIDDGLPIPFGPPLAPKPPYELVGDLLLEMGQADEARRAYQTALARTPRRPLAVLGLLHSERALGRTADAARTKALLDELWRRADTTVRAAPPRRSS